MSLDPQLLQVVLDEGPGASPLATEERLAAVRALLDHGLAVTCPGVSSPLPASDPNRVMVVVARPAPREPSPARVAPANARRHLLTLGLNPAELPLDIEAHQSSLAGPPPAPWMPWFPVIDYARCVNCLQCLGFCLFGVYGVDDDGRIQVQEPDHCKTLCPACARVCPEAAIMFPKHSAPAINGDPVHGPTPEQEPMKVDLDSLLQGNLHDLLRNRSDQARTRFDKDRDADQALSERQRCLRQFGGLAADIPPEVLRGLPTPEEIARKAAEAAARVAAAQTRPTPPPPP